MVLRMRNFNVLRVLWKIRLLMMRGGGEVHKKKNSRGRRLPKKGEGLGLFADLRREPWQEIGRGLARNRGCFWGGLRPQSHYGGGNRLTHAYKYIFTSPVMCLQQLCVLHWMNNLLISKIYFPQWLCYWKIIHLWKSYLFIRFIKSKFLLRNANNTDRNGINKENTHIHQTLRKITLEMAKSLSPLWWGRGGVPTM